MGKTKYPNYPVFAIQKEKKDARKNICLLRGFLWHCYFSSFLYVLCALIWEAFYPFAFRHIHILNGSFFFLSAFGNPSDPLGQKFILYFRGHNFPQFFTDGSGNCQKKVETSNYTQESPSRRGVSDPWSFRHSPTDLDSIIAWNILQSIDGVVTNCLRLTKIILSSTLK